MMCSATGRVAKRSAWVSLVALLVFCLGFEVVKHHEYAAALVGLLLPGATVRLAVATGRGELLRMRAVAVSFWAPVAVMLVSLPDAVPLSVFIARLAWSLRLAVARLAGAWGRAGW
jgi:hypothetical protein